MGRELASAIGRWFVLDGVAPLPVLVGVADPNPKALGWFHRIPSVEHLVDDYHQLLATDVDVIYAAVPHDLHDQVYCDVLAAGKDLLAEKPFGIDLTSAQRIVAACEKSGRFVRCSSEFPFFPGALRVYQTLQNGHLGELLEVNASFLHSSDLDLAKPINWKRQVRTCGEAGVMNDLGLHVVHLPFRAGLLPERVYAQLQNVVKTRPDGKGGMADCDTWDNATLTATLPNGVPMRLETKRLAPGQINSWSLEVIGTRGGVKFSTKQPKTLWTYQTAPEVGWVQTDLGHASVFPVATGGIFEFGFPDALLQMFASFLVERTGVLEDRFGCATPTEALLSHALWAAAMKSHETQQVENVT